jgi:deazaflavin-dependent oxidoreductase (nitroreductase family)
VTDDDPDFAYLTTTGRRSGKPHRIEIWYRRLPSSGARVGDVVWLLAGGGARSDWVQNLLADPHVTIEIGGEALRGVASVDDQDAPEARRSLAARYQGWRDGQALSDWATGAMAVAVRISPRS